MAVATMMVAVVVAGTGQSKGAKLHHSTAMLAGAVRVAYAHASATSRSVRLVFDFEKKQFWLEEAERPMLVQSKDTTGTGGADPATDIERAAIAERDKFQVGPQPPKSSFKTVEVPGLAGGVAKGPRPLEKGIIFKSVQSMHDDEPRKEGHAYLYFWPGGQTERSVISLAIEGNTDDDSIQSLLVSPLTGKTEVKSGPQELKRPSDDKSASERDEPGGL